MPLPRVARVTQKSKLFRLILPLLGALALFILFHAAPKQATSAASLSSSPESPSLSPTIDTSSTLSATILAPMTATPTPPAVTLTPVYTPTTTPTIGLPTPLPSLTPTLPFEQILTSPLTDTLSLFYFPLIFRVQNPIPPEKELFCTTLGSPRSIPDNNTSGINDTILVSDPRLIADLDVTLDANHTWVGDLRFRLTHAETGREITLINRPGHPDTQFGCGNDNVRTILDDEISSPVENKCAASPAALSGIYLPQQALSQFDGISVAGTWTLNVADLSEHDTGNLRNWCLVANISEVPPPPTPEPPIPPLPSQAIINGVTGRVQALPLDCESRSAVDWAKFLGYSIGELAFFNNLPVSDNPDTGFVGDVYGTWGQIPPNPYGVHAEPVAALLRDYGLSAYAHRPLRWEQLKAEIAEGYPVFVWITGNVENGIPVYYTPSDGLHTIVARYEHTVIVTGYTNTSVYYLNGATIYTKTINQFLDSWSALGNMAITTKP